MKKETSAQLLALAADTLVQTVRDARRDGVVTDQELDHIEWQVGHLRLRAEGHATRTRLGMRLINGGVCDRELAANVRSYATWSAEEQRNLSRLEPREADEKQAA